MQKIIIIAIAFMSFCGMSFETAAQKFGHVNSGNILIQMAETKQADDALLAFQEGEVKAGQAMANAFKTKLEAYQQKAYVDQTLSPKQMADEEAALTKEQQAIQQKEQEVIAAVNKKREELMTPILVKLKEAIDAVGKENGYTMIFDSSIPNTILFAQDADDLGPLVKKKLGMQ